MLSQRQGLSYDSNKNESYYGQTSKDMAVNVTNFAAPDAATALFAIWVADADFVWLLNNYPPPFNTTVWSNTVNQSITNHLKAIQNLYYNKGARTFIMPNAVDLTKVPTYSGLSSGNKSFVRQRVIDFNTGLLAMLDQQRTLLPDITIYVPDMFTLLDNLVAHPTNYGMTNSISFALHNGFTPFSGPGTNYVFWDDLNPGAKVQEIIADTIQALISPAQISKFTMLTGSNRLDVVNLPLGLGGFVDGSTNLLNWTMIQSITTNAAQSVFVPASSGPLQLYRLRFPFAWFWP